MSKKCPQCGSIYTDQTLNFCLTDGSTLINEDTGEKTLELPGKETEKALAFNSITKENTAETQINQKFEEEIRLQTDSNKNVSRFWLFATIGLSATFFFSFITLTGIYFVFDPSNENANINNLSTSNSETNKLSSSNVLSSPPSPTPKPEISYRVTGVANNDVLYIRPSAGDLKAKVGSIPSNGKGVIVTGSGKKVGKSVWLPVNYQGKKGWVNSRFLVKEN